MTARTLTQQAVFVPELDRYYRSSHVHDYVTIAFPDGAEYSLDGGTDYMRRGCSTGFDHSRIVDWSLYEDDSFDMIKRKLLWGTYGISGDQPLRWKPLIECDSDHLRAILKTQVHVKGSRVERVALAILKERI